MLAKEYMVTAPFVYHLQPGWTNTAQQQNIFINCINFTQHRFGLTNHRITARQKALAVVRKPLRHTLRSIILWDLTA